MGRKQTKRPPKGEPSATQSLRRQLERNGLLKDGKLRPHEEGDGPKVSACLSEIMEPYREAAPTRDAFEKLVTLAVIAWNAAVLEGDERQALIDTTVKAIVASAGSQWRRDAEETIAALLARKQRLFPDDRRYIVDFSLVDTRAGYHLSVAVMPMR